MLDFNNKSSSLYSKIMFHGLGSLEPEEVDKLSHSFSKENEFVESKHFNLIECWKRFKLFLIDHREPNTLVSSLILQELEAGNVKVNLGLPPDDLNKFLVLIEDLYIPQMLLKFERFKLLTLHYEYSSQDLNNTEGVDKACAMTMKVISSLCGFHEMKDSYLKAIIKARDDIDDSCKWKLLSILHLDDKFDELQCSCKENKVSFTGKSKEVVVENEKSVEHIAEGSMHRRGESLRPADGEVESVVSSQISQRQKHKPVMHRKTLNISNENEINYLKKNEVKERDEIDLSKSYERKQKSPNRRGKVPFFKCANNNKSKKFKDAEGNTCVFNLDSVSKVSIVHKSIRGKPSATKKIFSCNVCSKSCSLYSKSSSHIKSHAKENHFKCDICNMSFKGKAKLGQHKLAHAGEKSFNCLICRRSFADRSHLNAHLRIHCSDNPFTCDICGASFSESTKLKVHIRGHSGEKTFICEICGSSFSVSSSLKSHMKIHSGKRPYKCNLCDFASVHSSNLKAHILVHTGEKRHICDKCGASFTETAKLKRHQMVHTGERPYSCEVCGSRFADKSHLTVHLRIHSGEKPFKCSYCSSAFVESSKLKNHLRTHTGEKPYICEVCGASFAVSYSLKSHMRRHTGEKPYRCELCGYATSQSSNLKTHMVVHNGNRPHTCDECGASFSETSKMNRHKKVHLDMKDDASNQFTDSENPKSQLFVLQNSTNEMHTTAQLLDSTKSINNCHENNGLHEVNYVCDLNTGQDCIQSLTLHCNYALLENVRDLKEHDTCSHNLNTHTSYPHSFQADNEELSDQDTHLYQTSLTDSAHISQVVSRGSQILTNLKETGNYGRASNSSLYNCPSIYKGDYISETELHLDLSSL